MPNTQFKIKQKLEYIPCYLCGNDTYEIVLTSHSINTSIHHIFEPLNTLKEIRRILKLSLHNLRYGKYRFISKLSRFKMLMKMLNFILAMFGPCDIIVIHSRKKTSNYTN